MPARTVWESAQDRQYLYDWRLQILLYRNEVTIAERIHLGLK
jgi:hypothetical protein